MKKLVLLIIVIAATFVWYGFEGKSVTATTESETSSDCLQLILLEQTLQEQT